MRSVSCHFRIALFLWPIYQLIDSPYTHPVTVKVVSKQRLRRAVGGPLAAKQPRPESGAPAPLPQQWPSLGRTAAERQGFA